MKRFVIKYLLVLLFTFLCIGCEDVLDIEPKDELGTETFLATEEGINSVLNHSYAQVTGNTQSYETRLFYSILTSQLAKQRWGVYEINVGLPCGNFTWTSNQLNLGVWWLEYYQGIRNANIVIDNIEGSDFSEEFKTVRTAEAKALRAWFYYSLYTLFGPVPIHTTVDPENLKKARATDEEMKAQIEQDLIEVAAGLPIEPQQWGRVTKGAALGLLTKFYLNTKQWQKSIDAAQEVIDLGIYGLVPDYKDIYSFNNLRNEEVVWVVHHLNSPDQVAQDIIGIITPPDYPLPAGQRTYATRNLIYDWFVGSFDSNDTRKDLIVTEYVNIYGDTIQGLGNDYSISFKYPIDYSAMAAWNGMDMMIVRYADILLSLAEALNEVNGPTDQSINLINQIRNRAGVNPVQLSDFPSKEDLRDHILNERLWEFYFEGMEREDLIRHGKFISNAREHGVTNAQDYHVLFPIPQAEIDANSLMVQNPGY
jgi:hypothetical protein